MPEDSRPQRDQQQEHGYSAKGDGVGSADSVEHLAHEPGEREAGSDADHDADQRQPHPLPQHQAQDVDAVRASAMRMPIS